MSRLRLPQLSMPRMRLRVPRIRLGLLVPALVALLVVVGVAVGHGINSHAVKSGYDLAWLPDSTSGQAVQVDPVAGTANIRMQVASPGHPLQIEQGNGHLVVVDKRTGKITTIDLSTLLVGGSRAGAPGSAVQVLLAGSRMYVANLDTGAVQAVDPATEADIGAPWSAGRALIDVGLDGANDVWALDATSHLIKLGWSAAHQTLEPQSTNKIAGGGKGSVVVGHDKGVTVVGGSGGVARVGTGHDTHLSAPGVSGPLAAPQSSPTGLVPAAAPSTSSVVIVGKKGVVVDNVAPLGCAHPGVPAAFSGKVYVPCDGAHKVIVLGRDGNSAAAPIPTKGSGNAQLVISGGRLLINVPGAGSVSVVNDSGTTVQVPTGSRTTGVHNPTSPPPEPPAPPPVTTPPARAHQGGSSGHERGGVPVTHRSTHARHGTTAGRRGGRPGGSTGHTVPGGGVPAVGASSSAPTSTPSTEGLPGTTPSTDTPSTNTPPPAPTGSGTAAASAKSDGSVLVSWRENTSTPATRYVVEMTGTDGATVAQAPEGSGSATVTVLDPGTTAAFVVHAYVGEHELWQASTGIVTTYARPGAVSGVSVSHSKVSDGTVTLSVSWRAAAAHGATVVYHVSTPHASAVTTKKNSARLQVPCTKGCSGTVTVQPTNAAGDGTSGTDSFQVADPTPPPTDPPHNDPPPPPPPPAVPADGATFVTVNKVTNGGIRYPSYGRASVELGLDVPSSWSTWVDKVGPSCALYDNDTRVKTFACADADGTTDTLTYTTGGEHEYQVKGTGSNGSVTSTTTKKITVSVYRGPPCPRDAGATRIAGNVPLHALPYCGDPTCDPTPRICTQPRSNETALLPGSRPAELAWIILLASRSWLP